MSARKAAQRLDPREGALTREQARQRKLDDALIKEIQWNRLEQVQVLLRSGASPEARDAHRRPAVLCALILGHLECAEALFAAGASLEATTGSNDSLLISIAERFAAPVAPASLAWLIERKAPLNHVANSGLTALGVLASIRGSERPALSLPLLKALLEAGADPNAGRLLPLELALYADDPELLLLRELLARGADPRAKGAPESLSAQEIASMNDNREALRLMRAALEARDLARLTPEAARSRGEAPRL